MTSTYHFTLDRPSNLMILGLGESIRTSMAKKKENNELLIARYFMPDALKHILVTPEDEKMFIEWASAGRHKDKERMSGFDDGFNALVWGKKAAGRTVHELYEPGVLSGDMPYITFLGYGPDETPPRYVVNFIKGEMFKGMDSELIEKCYQNQVHYWNKWRTFRYRNINPILGWLHRKNIIKYGLMYRLYV